MDIINELFNITKQNNNLILIYGPAASGKSTLAMQTALEVAKNSKVLFLDTENSFSIERVKLMNNDYEKLLNNIFILPIKDFDDQCDKFDSIENLVKKGKFKFVIIDSFGIYYRLALHNGRYKEVNNKVVLMMRSLKHVVESGIPVLITNQVYSNNDGEIKYIGGNMIKNFSDIIIELNLLPRKMRFHKPNKLEVNFKIENLGLIGF